MFRDAHKCSLTRTNTRISRAILGTMAEAACPLDSFQFAQHAFSDRRISDCLNYLQVAELSGHDRAECSAYRWLCWMLLGKFENAWCESDLARALGVHDPNRLWACSEFSGRRVLIRCLHGFGDAIQFLRYARLLRGTAASVTAQTHPELVALLGGIRGIDRVTTWSDGPGLRGREWDEQIEVMELPYVFRTTLSTIPDATPYLSVNDRYCAASRRVLGTRRRPRVGILWEGGNWNPARNVPLSEFSAILEVPGFDFYSFQRGAGREELASLPVSRGICDISGDSPETVYMAADLLQMDLLITVDTMAAHLAGALGKLVWVLLPFEADWRWMLDRTDSPWYPTMRLFRQHTQGDWRWPVRQVVRELNAFAEVGQRRRRPQASRIVSGC
jgi:hypothetical protein